MQKRKKYLFFLLIAACVAASLAACDTPAPDLRKIPGHSITFYLNDGTNAIHGEAVVVIEGGSLQVPLPPTREGYLFLYWATEAEGYALHNFAQPITADKSLWAQWEREIPEFLVSFRLNDGGDTEFIAPKVVSEGERLQEPEPPSRRGYRFLRWTVDQVGRRPLDFALSIMEDLTLYAQWRAFPPPTYELDERLSRFGNSVSVYFKNLETGFVYLYNPDRVFPGASVPKAPFSMYIYQKADRGEIELNTWQLERLRRNLMYSCNDSTLALRNVHGVAGYRQWVAELGGNPDWVWGSIMGSRLNAEEAGLFAREIHRYIESDSRYSGEFKTHLLNNQFAFIVSDYPVASKSGWTSTMFHDMAIVYALSPYILVILSAGAGHRNFEEISMMFQLFNDTWFVD